MKRFGLLVTSLFASALRWDGLEQADEPGYKTPLRTLRKLSNARLFGWRLRHLFSPRRAALYREEELDP
jgi:hypothetical protein